MNARSWRSHLITRMTFCHAFPRWARVLVRMDSYARTSQQKRACVLEFVLVITGGDNRGYVELEGLEEWLEGRGLGGHEIMRCVADLYVGILSSAEQGGGGDPPGRKPKTPKHSCMHWSSWPIWCISLFEQLADQLAELAECATPIYDLRGVKTY